MAAITKVSLSFKETRQKTLAKLEGIALLSLLGAALKNKFFFLFLYVFKRKLLVKFGGCFLNFSVFFCVVFVCLRKVFFERKSSSFLVQLSGFLLAKASPSKSQNQCFLVKLRALFFHEIFLRGRRHLSSCFFFLKDLLCLFKKLVIQSQMRFSVRFR